MLSWVDYVGEWLAYELGITSPRYQYVIDELISQQSEADEEARAEQEAIDEAREIEARRAAAIEEGGEAGPAADGDGVGVVDGAGYDDAPTSADNAPPPPQRGPQVTEV